jgi:phage gpG-like protein
MSSNEFFKNILSDLRVDLTDEFDRNFERKAFFSKKWDPKAPNGLIGKGKLRRSIRSKIVGKSIVFTSTEDYAEIHNEGGEITVTEKMKRFFWAKAYEAGGKTRTKSGKKSKSKSADKWGKQAEIFKGLALKKVGSKIKIPQRQIIGNAPEVNASIKRIADFHINELLNTLFKK